MRQMKDSGIEWIGEIPQDWNIIRLRFLCEIKTGNQDTQDRNPDGKYPFYVRSPIVEKCDNYSFDGSAILMAGDGVGAGKVFHIVDGKYGCHQRVYSLQNIKDIDRKYLYYILQNRFYVSIDTANSKSTVDSVRQNMLLDFPVVHGTWDVQRKIVCCLDNKCTEIDNAIAKTTASIEEYKKLKQSIITKAVTKGIRGNRPMKDSGIEWIGEIPSDWKTLRGKMLFYEVNNRSDDGDEELLTVSHITGITPRSVKNVNMFMSESLVDYKICEVGDIAANTMWLWQGAIGVSRYRGVISPSYNTYRQRSSVFDSTYLDYMLRIGPLVNVYKTYSTGIVASRLRLYPKDFLSIHFPVPPMQEQVELGVYLNFKCNEIDNIISRKQQLITELEAYKKSLIYEYVTGKKEVV